MRRICIGAEAGGVRAAGLVRDCSEHGKGQGDNVTQEVGQLVWKI